MFKVFSSPLGEMVYTADLKSAGFTALPVQVWQRAPFQFFYTYHLHLNLNRPYPFSKKFLKK